ncbi:MAG TPA: hypothetical protein VGQ76_27750 [Thermoanaerobaculia bacterium]|jgi:hypothetical protein|nr:hypothetical protein [Thermoanaerobaculia bacterium]
MTTQSLRALLEGLVDYAGLFPPAALSMQDAVRNYARYRDKEHAWALGHFVIPADRAEEVPREFPLSILGIDEVKAANVDDIERIARDANGRTVYVEITDIALLDSLARHGLRAKIRTGGVTVDAFPPIADVARFLRACRDAGVAFKATAGLHHPLRCVKPLTYAANAPTGTMHGFLNVFLAAALLDHADEILREGDPHAFSFDDEVASWRGHRVSTDALRTMRREFATSFGSCSFEEPIGDLRALGWLSRE